MERAKAASPEERIQLMNDMFQRAFENLCGKYENSQKNASLDVYIQLKTNCEDLQYATQFVCRYTDTADELIIKLQKQKHR